MSKHARVGSALAVEQVPTFDFSRQYRQIEREVLAAIASVCSSQRFINGPEVAAFERESARFLGLEYGIGCASGADALWLCLSAARIGPGDEVITTPFTFFATAGAILRVGARPVLVDIDPLTFNLDPDAVERRVQQNDVRLKALVPVHLFGHCANMDEFLRIANEHKILVIEDAGQAFGATWRGRRAGSMGDAASFSFSPANNFGCFGDGGLVTTNNETLADRLRVLQGRRDGDPWEESVGNSCLDSIQAAVLRLKLKYIEQWNGQRREQAAIYHNLFEAAGLVQEHGQELSKGVTLPHVSNLASPVFHQYVIRASSRDKLRSFLADRNIGSEIYFPTPLSMQAPLRFLGYTEKELPHTTQAAREVLALPIFPEITELEQRRVVEAIADFYS